MLDLGLIGGWAAGGPAAEAGNLAKLPAGATVAADADVTALAGAFLELVDAFAGGPGASTSARQADAADSVSPPDSESDAEAAPVVVPPIETSSADVPLEGAPRRRFFFAHEPTPEGSADNQTQAAVPCFLDAPLFEPRIDIDRSTKTETAPVTADRVAESDIAPAIPPPMAPVATAPLIADAAVAPRDVSATNTVATDSARQSEGPARFAAPLVDAASRQLTSAAAADSAPAAFAPAESMPAPSGVTAVMAVAGDGAHGRSLSTADARKSSRMADPHADAYRASSLHTLRAAALYTEASGDAGAGTHQEPARDFGGDSAMNLSRQDVTRLSAASRGRDVVLMPDAPQTMASASRLASGLVAAGYAAGDSVRTHAPVTTDAATFVSHPVVTIPHGMPSMTAGTSVFGGLVSGRAAADTPAVPADVEGTAPQIVQAIRLAWSRGAGEAHIRLDPAQFGDLSVSLRVESGQVVARLQAETPAVREWLQTNQRTLQDQLAEHQLKLTRFEVVPPGEDARDASGRDTREQHDEAHGRSGRRPKGQHDGEGFEVVA